MGYDLNFWRYADESLSRTTEDHVATYLALCDGKTPDGLVELPAGAVRGQLDDALGDWEALNPGWRKGEVLIEFLQTDVWVRFDLRGRWNGDHANALIDVMQGFGCALFDPQTNERFALG